jgi:anhydro-N-acetylmuramic acid kinase
VILNIGGIANVTYLPRGCKRSDVVAFDTGPGNMVLDELFRVLFPGDGAFDDGGVRAAAGTLHPELLDVSLSHPYFAAPPPKSAGHREFGAPFAWQLNSRAESLGVGREDTLATAAELTARTVIDACERFLVPRGGIDELFLTGGGSRHRAIVSALEERLDSVDVRPVEDLGVSADAKEAVDFVVLAREALFGRSNVLSSATGSARDLAAGCIALGGTSS